MGALLRTLLVFTGLATLFMLVAGLAARRYGRTGVLAAWVAAAVLMALTMTIRLQSAQASLGFAPNSMRDARTIAAYTALSFAAFGAAALVVWRHHRHTGRLSGLAVLSGVAAFFAGVIAFFVVFLLADLVAVLPV